MRSHGLSMLFGVVFEEKSSSIQKGALESLSCVGFGSLTVATAGLLFGLMGWSSCKKEGKQLGQAFKQTIDYSTQFDEKTKIKFQRGQLPKDVWRAGEDSDDPNRRRFDIDFWVDRNTSAEVIRHRLQALVTTVKQGSPYKAVRARAWIRGLVHFGDWVGEYWLASDGGGWDGNPIGYRHLAVYAVTNMPSQPYRVAVEAERAWVELMKKRRMKRLARKNPEAVDRKAFESAAERLGLTPQSVADKMAQVRGLFVAARAGVHGSSPPGGAPRAAGHR